MKYFLLFTLSQLADVGSTAFSLAHGGFEMNPLAKVLLANGGFITLLGFKALVIAWAGYVLYRATRYSAKYIGRVNKVVLVLSVIALAVAAWNMVAWL